MSEYQYYEFLAIDRPLSKKEMDAVGEFSTRAEISPTRFVNEYHWGDFRGGPENFMEKWYDAMLYLANWGTHRFMCRVPVDLVDLKYATACCAGGAATMKIVNQSAAIFDFRSDTEDGGEWVDEGEGAGVMASIAPIRAELLAGDNRPLYLAWLSCVQSGELDEDKIEPAVPPGLKRLSTPQIAFADFLRINDDLITAAAQNSLPAEKTLEGFERWLKEMPVTEKDALLISLVNGAEPHAGTRLRRRFAGSKARGAPSNAEHGRNVAQLLATAKALTDEREALERELAMTARSKKEAADKAKRTAYLDQLAGREEQTWGKIDLLIATKQTKSYDESVSLLRDLRDLADRLGSRARFASNVQSIVDRHIRKPSLIDRIRRAGLTSASNAPR